ncbi:unnamed protein product [Knipowitschia caucasica]
MSALIIRLCLLLTLTEGQRFVRGAERYQKPTRHERYNLVLEPESEPELDLQLEPKPELRAGAVVVRCHADSMEVLVHADLYSTGLRVDGAHLRLGFQEHKSPEKCRAAATGPSEYTLQSLLMDCGTVKHPSSEEIVYSNVLIYAPKPSSEGLLRLGGATIPIKCHYNKFYSVNLLPLSPDWSPFISHTTAKSKLDFNLKLMTGDWQSERGNHAYYVGDQIYLEASSVFGNHKPLHIFVDRCVATTTADENAALRYDFIDHGCLADAYLTNSSARFRLRTEKHKIQFQLDAFKFYQEKADQIFITCHLTAVPSLVNVKSRHRACSLIANRWRSADGNDEDCGSCNIPYPVKDFSTTAPPTVSSQRSRNIPKLLPASYMRVRPTHSKPHSTATMKEGIRKGTVFLGPLVVLPSQR